MPTEEEFRRQMDEAADRIFQALEINLAAQASRSALTIAEFIETQRALGVSDAALREILFEDLRTGGRIFGEFVRSIEGNLAGRLGELANKASKVEFGLDGSKRKIWIAALVNTCPDCLPRHGEVDTERNWELRGEPRTGWSVCRLNCQCQLLDAADAEGRPELREPLRRR